MKKVKTNAVRILDNNKIDYEIITYEVDPDNIDGISVANKLNQDLNIVFKTLLTYYNNSYYVFLIPVDRELDLKKCAKIVSCKSLELVHVKDLLKITGYIRGGCSPLGMKKVFPTYIDSSAKNLECIIFSGGKQGIQIKINPLKLSKILNVKFNELVK